MGGCRCSGRRPTKAQGCDVVTTDVAVNGVRVGVRYAVADTIAGVGGDWFLGIALPGGDVMLAVGDVMGHGPDAAGTMHQLRASMTSLPKSITSQCAGRTNCASPAPQRMRLAMGSASSDSATTAGSSDTVGKPALVPA